jgi:hypothetical protein
MKPVLRAMGLRGAMALVLMLAGGAGCAGRADAGPDRDAVDGPGPSDGAGADGGETDLPLLPAFACDDDTGLMDCCPGEPVEGQPCPYASGGECWTACGAGFRSHFVCSAQEGQPVWGAGVGLFRCFAAATSTLLPDGGYATLGQVACDDGTGRTDCCALDLVPNVPCGPPMMTSQPECWTRCTAGSTTLIKCSLQIQAYATVAERTESCAPDAGVPADRSIDAATGPDR